MFRNPADQVTRFAAVGRWEAVGARKLCLVGSRLVHVHRRFGGL